MASSKDTFESGTFLAATFGSGTWRGVGATIGSREGSEFAAAGIALHFVAEGEPTHAKAGGYRSHYGVRGEPMHARAAGSPTHYKTGED